MQERKNHLITISVITVLITAFLPYKSIYSFDRINNHSRAIFKAESTINFSTTYYSYESIEFLLSITLLVIIFLIARFAKKPFKYIMLFTYIMGEIGNYKLFLSFPIMLVCSTYIIFNCLKHVFKY